MFEDKLLSVWGKLGVLLRGMSGYVDSYISKTYISVAEFKVTDGTLIKPVLRVV